MKYSFTNFQVLVSPSLFAGELTFCCNLFIRRSVGYQSVCLHFFLFLLSLSLYLLLLFLPPSFSFYLSIFPSRALPLSVCTPLTLSFLPSPPLSIYPSLSRLLSLSMRLSVYLSLSLSVPFYYKIKPAILFSFFLLWRAYKMGKYCELYYSVKYWTVVLKCADTVRFFFLFIQICLIAL